MFRLFVLVLLLLNGTYLAWSQGLLVGLGFVPVQQAEPQRLGQQIKPQAVRLLSAQEVMRFEPALPAPQKPVQ